jgi:hypothetical protein
MNRTQIDHQLKKRNDKGDCIKLKSFGTAKEINGHQTRDSLQNRRKSLPALLKRDS